MNTLKKLFGTMLVLGLVSGLASSAVAASFTAASVEPDKRVSTHPALRVSDAAMCGQADEARLPSPGW